MRVRRFADWSPHQPNGSPSRISTPTGALWLHYGAVGRANFATAVAHTRYHIVDLGWLHTGYQGYVIPGQLLLARPADRMGAHTRGHQTDSALCVPGDGRASDVTDRLLDTLAWAAVYGHRQGWWPPEFAGSHRQAPRNRSNTPCSGDPLTRAVPEINRRARRLLIEGEGFIVRREDEDTIRGLIREVVRDEVAREVWGYKRREDERDMASLQASGGLRADELDSPHQKDQARQVDEIHRTVKDG